MPIRFRCAYCNQLMGIARRKAGTVVSCPNCSGQVVVPSEDDLPAGDAPAPAPQQTESEPPLFERGDFDDVFGKKPIPPPVPAPRPTPMPPPAAAPPGPALRQMAPAPSPAVAPGAPPRLDLSPSVPASVAGVARPPGYVLSPSMATLLSVAIIIALALAFIAGLLVGRFYLQPSPEEGYRTLPAEIRLANALSSCPRIEC